jgi:MerR family transcriptional regulator, heat shock protein HspR
MTENYYYRKQVLEIFHFDEGFLDMLEKEDLICPVEMESCCEKVFTPEQLERLRIIRNLVEELEVNVPGVEVILSMRENMILMQQQFQQILEILVKELKARLGP